MTLLERRLFEEFLRRERLKETLERVYEAAPRPEYCVRRLEVVEHVARTMGIRVLNNDVFADVERAARALGWEPIRNGNRRLFRGVKRRDQDADVALAFSRANRRDPRSSPSDATVASYYDTNPSP